MEGVNVNYEWVRGYIPRFGLIAVGRKTQQRSPKPGARWLGAVAQQNRIEIKKRLAEFKERLGSRNVPQTQPFYYQKSNDRKPGIFSNKAGNKTTKKIKNQY